MTNCEKSLAVPKPESHFFLPDPVIDNLERIKLLAGKHPVNVLVTGKQGCGKSTMVRQFAARNNRPIAVFQIGILSEPVSEIEHFYEATLRMNWRLQVKIRSWEQAIPDRTDDLLNAIQERRFSKTVYIGIYCTAWFKK